MAKRTEELSDEIKLAEAGVIYQKIRKLLMGKGPVVQAMAITEIAGAWIYGHEPASRPAMIEALMLQIIHFVEKLDEEQPWPPQQH